MTELHDNRPIFIVGCERSGTTMLRLILCSHKNIALPPQTKYIKKLYKRRILFGDLSKEKNRKKLQEWFYNNHNKRTKLIDLEIDRDIIQDELRSAGNTLGAYLSVILKLYSEKNGKVRWGDKHPYYIKYLSQLYQLFPDAQVIHIIRDGRDAVASLKKMPWWKNNSVYAMLNWQEAIQNGKKALQKYYPNQFMEIRYEDIIDNPQESIHQVCDFLREDFSDDLLKFHKIADKSIPSYKMDWHSGAKKEINAMSIGRWSKDLEDWEVSLISKKMKKELSQYKYDFRVSPNRIPLSIYIKYLIIRIRYKINQYGTIMMDWIMSIFYRWELDHRK